VELTELLKTLFENYGAAALPWSVVAFLGWFVLKDRKGQSQSHSALPDDYEHMIDRYHEALIDSTRTIERLAVLLEERTLRRERLSFLGREKGTQTSDE
jgi:hypothetical protein